MNYIENWDIGEKRDKGQAVFKNNVGKGEGEQDCRKRGQY